MEAIKEKESVSIRVFRVFRDQKNKSELFGTMRNDAEPCGHFCMADVVSLHCLSTIGTYVGAQANVPSARILYSMRPETIKVKAPNYIVREKSNFYFLFLIYKV